jgi:putative tryptophan/tyrosine transport system substrate-binding protein
VERRNNLHFDLRWSAGDINRASSLAKELVALQPDVILTAATPSTAAIHRETQTTPIVFVQVADPVGSGQG